jgi:hypothetical protein
LDVLTLAIKQTAGVRGQGFGTRIVNLLKSLLAKEGLKMERERKDKSNELRCFMLTQADEGPVALNFWLKQKLSEGEDAKKVLGLIHEADPRKNVWYDQATPMLCQLNLFTGFVIPSSSPRAQVDRSLIAGLENRGRFARHFFSSNTVYSFDSVDFD